MRVSIRQANLSDIPLIIEMGERLHVESRYREVPFSAATIEVNLKSLLGAEDFYCKLSYLGDKPTGLMAGMKSPFYFSKNKMASDLIFFVEQDSRGSMAAVLLIRDFQRWAYRDPMVSEVQLGITTGIEEARTGQLMGKLGFDWTGSLYVSRPHA